MSKVQFGFCLPIFASPGVNLFRTPNVAALDAAETLALGRLADELGYDSLWVADHLMLGQDDAILEGWTTLAALAGATSRAKLGMIHQSNAFRHPALAAKMAATLDQLSGGRLIHFMDCGYMGREYIAYGLPWDEELSDRVDRLAEAIALIRTLWTTDGPVTHDGRFYQVTDAVCRPKPVQRPHPPLWFGETTPGILALCAREGDGWNTTPVSLPELRRRLEALAEACDQASRPISEIEKSLETQILLAPDRASLRTRLQAMVDLAATAEGGLPAEIQPFLDTYATDPEMQSFLSGETDSLPTRMTTDWIVGTPNEVEDRLRDYQREGISHFMLWFMDAPGRDGIELFASTVIPRFR